MFSAVNLPLSPLPSQAYAVVDQNVPAEASLGSLPSKSVYGAIATPALNNQRGSQAAIPSPFVQTAPQTPAQSTLFNLSALSSPGGSPDFSSAFFTQLLAQSSPEMQAGIASSFAGAAHLRPGDPAVLASFSFVKYLPSDASKPEPRPLRVNPLPVTEAAPAETQVRVQHLQRQQQATAQVQVQSAPASAPQAQQNFATVVMRNSFSYAPVSGSPARDTSASSEESLRSDRAFLPKEATAAYERTASRIPVKTVEASAGSNT